MQAETKTLTGAELEQEFVKLYEDDESQGRRELWRILSSSHLKYRFNDLQHDILYDERDNQGCSQRDWLTKRIQRNKGILSLWDSIQARHEAVGSEGFETPLEAKAYAWRRMAERTQTEYYDSEDFVKDYPKLKAVLGDELDVIPLSGEVKRAEVKRRLAPGASFTFRDVGGRARTAVCQKIARVNVTTTQDWKVRIDDITHTWVGDERYKVVG